MSSNGHLLLVFWNPLIMESTCVVNDTVVLYFLSILLARLSSTMFSMLRFFSPGIR